MGGRSGNGIDSGLAGGSRGCRGRRGIREVDNFGLKDGEVRTVLCVHAYISQHTGAKAPKKAEVLGNWLRSFSPAIPVSPGI